MTKKIEGLSEKLLIFGGVYSNLQALEALKALVEEQNINADHIICTGDIIAYCAQPVACVELIRNWNILTISGNVEQQIAEGLEDCACDFDQGSRCDIFSKQWYPYAQSKIKGENLKWIQSLPEHLTFDYHNQKIVVLHGSFHNTSEFIFGSTPWKVKQKNFDDTEADIILSGHCGLPHSTSKNNKHWLNAGVIGMPANDGKSHVWYMTIEMVDGILHYEHHTLDYNHTTAAKKMNELGLVPSYAETLTTGLWDNMEILPEKERMMQGKELVL